MAGERYRKVIFLTYGDVDAPAYHRYRKLSEALANRDISTGLIVDRKEGVRGTISSGVETYVVRRRPHLVGVLERRQLLRRLGSDVLIVQLNPNLKAFLTLVGTTRHVVIEFDEPPIIVARRRTSRFFAWLIQTWFTRRSILKIACTRYLSEIVQDSHLLPHGYYLNSFVGDTSKTCDFAYLGNLSRPWDHDLIFTSILRAKSENWMPSIRIIGRGDDFDYWVNYCQQNELDNVTFLGYVPDGQLLQELNSARILLLPSRPTVLNRSRCSSKVLAYGQSDSLVVGHSVGDAKEILGQQMVELPDCADILSEARKLLSHGASFKKTDVLDHSYEARAFSFEQLVNNYSRAGWKLT